jgi:hypothetical protein
VPPRLADALGEGRLRLGRRSRAAQERVGDDLANCQRRRPAQEGENPRLDVVGRRRRLDADPEVDERAAADEWVVGEAERADPLGPRPADERAEPAAERADLAVGRRPALGEDDERSSCPDELDEGAEVGGRLRRPAGPDVLEALAEVAAPDRAPEDVGVLAAQRIARRRGSARPASRARARRSSTAAAGATAASSSPRRSRSTSPSRATSALRSGCTCTTGSQRATPSG